MIGLSTAGCKEIGRHMPESMPPFAMPSALQPLLIRGKHNTEGRISPGLPAASTRLIAYRIQRPSQTGGRYNINFYRVYDMKIEALCAAPPEALTHSPQPEPNATELPSSAPGGRPKLIELQASAPSPTPTCAEEHIATSPDCRPRALARRRAPKRIFTLHLLV